MENHCYLRWAPAAHYVMHAYGGALVQVAKKASDLKFAGHAFMIEQLVLPLLYHRTFLSRLRSDLLELSDMTEYAQSLRARSRAASTLQALYGEFLRFRARHDTGSISDSNANRECWATWRTHAEVTQIGACVLSSCTELQTYYAALAQEKQQQAVDALSVILGALGLAALGTTIIISLRRIIL
jgi:hypothetical protein